MIVSCLYQGPNSCYIAAVSTYRMGRCCSSHPPGAIFPSSIARQPRGCQILNDTSSTKKALGDTFPTPDLVLALDTINIPTVEIPTTEKSAQGCVTYTRHIRYSTKTHPCQKSPHVLLATKRVEQYGDERRDRCRNVRSRKKCCCGFSDNGTRQLFLRIW